MSATTNKVRRGFYLDSVQLMRLSRTLAGLDGIADAALMMGTPANKRIMTDARLLDAAGEAASGNDLVIAVRAATAAAAEAALAEAERLLGQSARDRPDAMAWRPRTIRAAVAAAPDATLALISVPGEFATAEARKALRRGLHVMIFSDNVTLADERALKEEARALGLLLMGPDCGTAIIGGVPLAFANQVPRGDIGIVGASGTGMQEVFCLIAQGGGGISHAIGVGGRDLKEEIGGITTLMALDALDRDPSTRHIVVVSKPPAPAVAAKIIDRVRASRKSFTLCFIGADRLTLPKNATLVSTLKAAAETALGGVAPGGRFDPKTVAWPLPSGRRRVRGLFAGGTLCAEAQIVFMAAGEGVASNAPVPGARHVDALQAKDHVLIDLGDDAYTKGRPHPMIEPAVREGPLGEAFRDPETGVVLLDLVIGYGAHPDPAGHLVDFLARMPADRPFIVASVTGTEGDPQRRSAQVATLEAAGIRVAPCNADAAAVALACLGTAGSG
jgi:succinyl-CoA synthetase alpha subunit